MAYNSGIRLASLAGVIGGGVGAYLGYNQAIATDMPPIQGALIMGAIGIVAGSAGAFVLKSALQFLIYLILIAAVCFFFRGQIEGMTGIDPVAAVENTLNAFGLSLPGAGATGE